MNQFSVVIPSRNVSNLILCAEAVRKCEPDARIIIMDDGLGLDWLPRPDLMPALGHICPKPFIFARNCNIGIGLAERDDVVLLNDDALLTTPGGFSAIQKTAHEHPEYGVISAACNNVGNRAQNLRPGCRLRGDLQMVCFVAAYIPRATIDKVGLLDEDLIGYGYDDDLYCRRVRDAGLKIGVHDGGFVDHSKLHPTFRGLPNVNALMDQNRAIYQSKVGPSDPRLKLVTRAV